jgi:hypothetical protein
MGDLRTNRTYYLTTMRFLQRPSDTGRGVRKVASQPEHSLFGNAVKEFVLAPGERAACETDVQTQNAAILLQRLRRFAPD